MSDVPLYIRSQLPPSRVGAVKPPDIPDISVFEAVAEFGGDILGKIRATRAGNEQSEFLGSVAIAQERAAAQIADKPGMSFEDMDKIQKQMMTEIKQAGKSLTLPESKNYARNFTLKNRELIKEKFNTEKEAILTQHEMTRFKLERERLITERKPDELDKLYDSASGTLLDPEVATLSFENDVLTIDAIQVKFDEEQLRQGIYSEAEAISATSGYQKAIEWVMKQKIDTDIKRDVVSDIKFEAAQQQDQLEIMREKDRDEISQLIRSGQLATNRIDNSNLDEKEQWTWFERARAEAKRLADGEEIITDNGVRTELYNDIMGILSLSKTKREVLDKAKEARFDPKNPTLSETDYSKIETAIHAQYEQAYGQGMGKVSRYAEGLLLNPDSLGYIKNAPIRYKILGDFNEAWLNWIASKGDTLKVSEIYPEGRRMAAQFQISDKEAERLEVEMNERLREREATIHPKMPTDKKILEAAKKVASGTSEALPRPKTKSEYDKLDSGTRYIDPQGVERTKK